MNARLGFAVCTSRHSQRILSSCNHRARRACSSAAQPALPRLLGVTSVLRTRTSTQGRASVQLGSSARPSSAARSDFCPPHTHVRTAAPSLTPPCSLSPRGALDQPRACKSAHLIPDGLTITRTPLPKDLVGELRSLGQK